MLAILNLSPSEITIALVVAIVVFGRRLPEVAGQVAGALQRMRRSMDDLRRETGIDREIRNAQREIRDAVPRDLGALARSGQESPPPQPAPPATEPVTEEAAPDAGPASGGVRAHIPTPEASVEEPERPPSEG